MWGAVYLLLMAIIIAATLYRPYYALVGLLTMFTLEQWGVLYFPMIRGYGQLTNILFLVLLIFSAARRLDSTSFSPVFGDIRIRFAAVLLFAYAAFSLLWTPSNANGAEKWLTTWPYLFAGIVLAPMVIKTIEDLQAVQRGLIMFGGLLVMLFAFVPEWGNRSLVLDSGDDLALPLALAQLSGLVLMASILHFRKNTLYIAYASVAVVCALIVIVKTGSRGQFMFSILCVGIVATYAWGEGASKKILPVILVIGVLAGVAFFIFQQTGLLTERWDSGELSEDFSGRWLMATTLLGEAFSSPFSLVFGLGNSASFSPDLLFIYPHIVPLEILAEEGFIGFAIFAWFVVTVFRSALLLLKSPLLTFDERRVVAVNCAWLLFTFLLCFKQASLVTSPELFMFAALHEKLFCLVRDRVAYSHAMAEEELS